MDTKHVLDHILNADREASSAYLACLDESKQAKLRAERKLHTLLGDAEARASAEADLLWQQSRAKIAEARTNLTLDNIFQERLETAKQRMDCVIDRLIDTLLSRDIK